MPGMASQPDLPSSISEIASTYGSHDNSVNVQVADDLKQEANELFRVQKWEQALSTYRSALGRLPKRPPPPNASEGLERDTRETSNEEEVEDTTIISPAASVAEPVVPDEGAQRRAVLNANIAACFVKLGDNQEVVKACTEALKDDGTYVKALTRRATANEIIGTWSALSSAQADYEKLMNLLPPSEARKIAASLARVKPRAEAAQKAEMGEMMDKLKGIGNSILGNFGLSTDNFKFEPNGQGGYSINFNR